eukprot:2208714-Rhodomonas_salina.1
MAFMRRRFTQPALIVSESHRQTVLPGVSRRARRQISIFCSYSIYAVALPCIPALRILPELSFPQAIGEMVQMYGVGEFHLSFAHGQVATAFSLRSHSTMSGPDRAYRAAVALAALGASSCQRSRYQP